MANTDMIPIEVIILTDNDDIKGTVYVSSNVAANRQLTELLNDSNPLPGEIIALITSFAIDAEERLKNGKVPELMLPPSDDKPQARLYALAQSAYGLSLGLSCDLKGFDDIKDKDLKDDLKTLIQIGKLDTESEELDEDDFKSVKDFMENLSLSFFKKRPSFITVKD